MAEYIVSLLLVFSLAYGIDLELEDERSGLCSIPWAQFPAVNRDIDNTFPIVLFYRLIMVVQVIRSPREPNK